MASFTLKLISFESQTANEKAGKHSGCMMWAGSNYDYNGIKCTFTGTFNMNETYEDRIDTALSWFIDGKTPANLVMMYFEEPDWDAHIFGPDSVEVSDE